MIQFFGLLDPQSKEKYHRVLPWNAARLIETARSGKNVDLGGTQRKVLRGGRIGPEHARNRALGEDCLRVKKELDVAMNREITSSEVVVLPLLFEPCELPEILKGRLYADFLKPEEYDAVLAKL